MTTSETSSPVFGLMASFVHPEELVAAARAAKDAGYTQLEAYTPIPLEELNELLAIRPTRLPYFVLGSGLLGGLAGYALQYYCAVIAYPLNIGGRPLNSWPAWIPVTFEMTILFAALAAVLGMLIFNRLPQPYHPVFNVPEFSFASRDRFFLSIEATDEQFDEQRTVEFLQTLRAERVDWIDP